MVISWRFYHHYISIKNESSLGFSLSIDGYSEGLNRNISGKSINLYSTLPIIPSGFNTQHINIDLGNNEYKWRTLYCNNLSDGTTTKTMADVLSGSNTSYQTTEPTSSISDGGIHIVFLGSEPTARYSGYIYLVAEEQ